MPAPTTLAIPSRVRLKGPSAFEIEALTVVLGGRQDRVEGGASPRVLRHAAIFPRIGDVELPVVEEESDQHEGFVEGEREHRLRKLEELRKRGIEPYPVRFDRDHSVADVLSSLEGVEAGRSLSETVRVAGRLMLIRRHGGLDLRRPARPHRPNSADGLARGGRRGAPR